MRMRLLAAGLVPVLACLAAVRSSLAATTSEGPVVVRVAVAGTECASEDAFFDALSRRVPRLSHAVADQEAPSIAIEIAHEGSGLVGRLRLSPTAGPPGVRVVFGRSCEEVLEALSLMTALALDPDAPASLAQSTPADAVPAEPVRDARAPEVPWRSRWRMAGGAFGWASGVGATALGGGLFADLEWDVARGGRGAANATMQWASAWRLGGSIAWLDTQVGPVQGSLSWRLVQLDGCPLRASLAAEWSLRPCASLEAGQLEVSARGVDAPHTYTRPWVAPGARLRLTWSPHNLILLGLDAAVMIPLLRDTFEVGPALRVFRAPVAVALMSASMGVRFF